MPSALSIDSLTKVYDGKITALDGVSMEISQGEFFGLLGPNGAGKTTLINILGNLVRPTSGSAKVMGYDVVTNSMEVKRQIGIVPQEIIFDPFFTLRQYLKQQSSYYGIYANDDWIDELLHSLGLTSQASTNTRKLSGGMKRRMMVALALVHKPAVVILDEPTAGVDVSQRRNLWSFIKKLNEEGTTVILTTHYLKEAEELCERIVMINHGSVLADEKTRDLLSNSRYHAKCINLRLADGGKLPTDLGFESTPDTTEPGLYHIHVDEYEDIEGILKNLRTKKIKISDLELTSTDLEEVFVSLTGNNKP